MIITYGGLESVKIQYGDKILAFNPISKDSEHKGPRYGADIALISLNDPDMNGADTVSRGDREPFVIKGPGEYEVAGLFIRGIASKSLYGGKERINTIYSLEIDDMRVAFLGALGDKELSPEAKEVLGESNILIVPIGGDGVLDASSAYELAVKREPNIIIPIHYGDVGDKDALKDFLKEGGVHNLKPEEKLTIKRKDLDGKEGEIVVLESQI